MSKRDTIRRRANDLATAAAAYQTAAVIPHCTTCSKPCCRLDTLVLELEWKQVKSFWHLEESRHAFDKRLDLGKGPEEIRAGNGLYYIHTTTQVHPAGFTVRKSSQRVAATFLCMKIKAALSQTCAAKP